MEESLYTISLSRRGSQAVAEKKNIGFIKTAISSVDSWSQTFRCYELTTPLQASKLIKSELSYDETLKKVAQFGAQRCPWEVAVAARLSITDQPVGDAFVLATEPIARPGTKGGKYRLPYVGNGLPKADAGKFIGVPFKGAFLTIFITEVDRHNRDRYYVFCR